MRIEEVFAVGFGPLRDARLRLAPGLTVVVGANESAKSSWHAATYAALCGIRRGRGQPDGRDREFGRRHRPWDGGPWRVGARLALDDGRLVEIAHELEDRVDCRAIDLTLGRDVSGEVVNDGTVDATMWLGLGRRAFEATACIRQAELLRVRGAGRELADLLGRAAATGGADESAAAALARLAEFQRDHVGADRANAVKPWRLAIDAEAQARRALDDARAARLAFDAHAQRLDELQAAALAARRIEGAARAARLAADATDLSRRAERAQGLADGLGPVRPAPSAEGAGCETIVAAALAGWRARPAVPAPGEDPHVLQAELDALPAGPDADSPGRAAVDAGRPLPRSRPMRWPYAALACGALVVVAGLVVARPALAAIGVVVALVGAVALVLRGQRRAELVAADDRAARRAAESAELAARRALLAGRLERARQDATRRTEALQAQARAQTALQESAAIVAVREMQEADGDALADALASWLDAQHAADGRRREAEARWRELDRLVGDGTLTDLQDRATQAASAAATASIGLDLVRLREAPVPTDADLAALATTSWEAARAAAEAEGGLAQRAAGLPDVSVLDEELAVAAVERQRVEALKAVLERTSEIMRSAQDRVHRDIAPRLQASLVRWLPVVTGGRYVDALVDPRSLAVQVCGPSRRWRDAERLSYGTAEQVYLLLRLALVEHLTAGHDTCPLLLDDITVHADDARTREILDLLLAVSQERQVVLFTQETAVADWARERLADVAGSVIELSPMPVG